MKTNCLQNLVAVTAITGLTFTGISVLAQDSPTVATAQPAATTASAPPLPYGVSQVLKLAQAEVSNDAIIAYIKNSKDGYSMTADQIIYLHQHGVSDTVLNTMINQPGNGLVTMPAAPAVASTVSTAPASSSASGSVKGATLLRGTPASSETTSVAPTVMYVQPVPQTVYYQPYYYPAYTWYPPVTFSLGWGWGWHGGWHGGGHGGWHH